MTVNIGLLKRKDLKKGNILLCVFEFLAGKTAKHPPSHILVVVITPRTLVNEFTQITSLSPIIRIASLSFWDFSTTRLVVVSWTVTMKSMGLAKISIVPLECALLVKKKRRKEGR